MASKKAIPTKKKRAEPGQGGSVEMYHVHDNGHTEKVRVYIHAKAGIAFEKTYGRHAEIIPLTDLFKTKEEALKDSPKLQRGFFVDSHTGLVEPCLYRKRRKGLLGFKLVTGGEVGRFNRIFETETEAIVYALNRLEALEQYASKELAKATKNLKKARKRLLVLKSRKPREVRAPKSSAPQAAYVVRRR